LIEEHHGLIATQNNDISVIYGVPQSGVSLSNSSNLEYTYIISGKKQFIIDEVVILEGSINKN
jgi:hypothetical protein